ncbi:MAG TPA: hydroxymethylbilane synthase [Solirubrobacteraceae bacterium]|jgi:hydroxymethylbilane synthase|nr:hydroxymethylbilane synthase [Solirubrobacteraceae bacterium]
MRIGTRGSALALAQARLVAARLEGAEIEVVRTSGDRGGEHGDKSRWVAELEQALLAGEVDLAVHSAKDLPGEPVDGLELLGAPSRESAEDVLIGAQSLEELPEGAYVGTSSARRGAQLLAARSDLEIVGLRGNVDTRLRKLAESAAAGRSSRDEERPLHAIVLAGAGLRRLGRERDIGCTLDPERFVPAPGQGALALQARTGDELVRGALAPILDKDASACLLAERALARALGGNCNIPLGAHATTPGCGCLYMRAWIGLPDGSEWIADELMGGFYDPEELGVRVAERLQAVGARDLLGRAETMAVAHG